MKAVITGENEERVGVNLRDNNDVEHVIEMEFDGEIKYHEQDGYPDDPGKRTSQEELHVAEARRFARYWVYRKRGYDTLDRWQNPDRLTVAALAVAPLTPNAAQTYFGDLYQQFRSIHGDAEPVVEMPDGLTPTDPVYQKEIYLSVEDETIAALAMDFLTNPTVLDEIATTIDITERQSSTEPSALQQALSLVTDREVQKIAGLEDGLLIEAVSGIHLRWDDETGTYHTRKGRQPALDRDPDARTEIFQYNPDSITELKLQLARHLVCQVRDCYIVMGLAPPEPLRILGPGRFAASTWYEHRDYYDRYHDPTADISTWFEEYTPEGAYEHKAEPPEQ